MSPGDVTPSSSPSTAGRRPAPADGEADLVLDLAARCAVHREWPRVRCA
jgi:hypothetical protein